MPESVTDRDKMFDEYIFLLTKSAQYYYDHEASKRTDEDGQLRPHLTMRLSP
jgi:hypothetical protein